MIHVETTIRTDVDDLWRHTQDPTAHRRWDLRFGRIDPLAQGRFRYATRVLPGVVIAGDGIASGTRHRADGTAVSALRFSSDDRRSIIRSGAGYWRYEPTPAGTRFHTGYDYRVRWARFGRLADRAFRPVFGWATAWSFDRLRLWLEDGVPPERALRNALADLGARVGMIALVALVSGPVETSVAAAIVAVVPPCRRTPAARRCVWSS
jgi:hypothetical protein